MSAPFVTDEIVRAATLAGCRAEAGEVNRHAAEKGRPINMRACDQACAECERLYRAALTAAAPLWLAHVRAASEHTADYRMAAAAVEIEKGLTT